MQAIPRGVVWLDRIGKLIVQWPFEEVNKPHDNSVSIDIKFIEMQSNSKETISYSKCMTG